MTATVECRDDADWRKKKQTFFMAECAISVRHAEFVGLLVQYLSSCGRDSVTCL